MNYKKISLTILSLSRNGNFSRIWFTTFGPLVSSMSCLLEENDNFCKFFSTARLMSFFWAFCNSFKSSLCRLSAPWEVSRTELFTSSCSRNALSNSCLTQDSCKGERNAFFKENYVTVTFLLWMWYINNLY